MIDEPTNTENDSCDNGAPSTDRCTVIELRQYTLHPGRRDELISLFDREFVETQEAMGMRVIGQFRDARDADRFVWLRGFADMASRRRGLEAFYNGPVWGAHADAANATMRASDDVLLLRPAWRGAALPATAGPRPPIGATDAASGLLDASIFPLRAPADAALIDFCRDLLRPTLAAAGATTQGWYATEASPNDFPRLPVCENRPVLAGFALFTDEAVFDAFVASGEWARDIEPQLSRWLAAPVTAFKLVPTARSALRC